MTTRIPIKLSFIIYSEKPKRFKAIDEVSGTEFHCLENLREYECEINYQGEKLYECAVPMSSSLKEVIYKVILKYLQQPQNEVVFEEL